MKTQRALMALTIVNTVAGPTNTKDTCVVLQSKGAVSSLKVRSEGGHEQVLEP